MVDVAYRVKYGAAAARTAVMGNPTPVDVSCAGWRAVASETVVPMLRYQGARDAHAAKCAKRGRAKPSATEACEWTSAGRRPASPARRAASPSGRPSRLREAGATSDSGFEVSGESPRSVPRWYVADRRRARCAATMPASAGGLNQGASGRVAFPRSAPPPPPPPPPSGGRTPREDVESSTYDARAPDVSEAQVFLRRVTKGEWGAGHRGCRTAQKGEYVHSPGSHRSSASTSQT